MNEKITTITCPKCETEIIYLPPDHGYIVIDEVRYLVPQAVCDLLQRTREARDGLRENKLYLENDLALKMEEIAALKAELKEQLEQGISIIHDQGAENIRLKEQIDGLKSLVDGASEVVEIYPAESPAQKEWRDNWLAKAREALK